MKRNWRKQSKRGLSLMVCLMMCLSMLPGLAYAQDTDEHEHDHDHTHDAVIAAAVETDDGEEAGTDISDVPDTPDSAGEEDVSTAPVRNGPPQQGATPPGGQTPPGPGGQTPPPRPGGQNPPPQQGGQELEEHEHTPAEAVRENETAATCGAAGSYDEVVYCSECGEELSREAVTTDPATGEHTYDSGEWVFTPTRLNGSFTTYTAAGTFTCTECGYSYSVQSTSVNSVNLSRPLTCESDANVTSAKVTYAAADGSSITVTGVTGVAKAPGHNWSSTWSKSTSTPKSHCKKCLNTYTSGTKCTKESEVADHTTVYTVTKPATCTDRGMYAYRCTVCSSDTNYASPSGYIDPLGHDWAYEYDETGHWAEECQRDGCSGTLEKTNHEFTRTVTTEPTCVSPGVAKYECECGYSYEEAIPATGEHAWETAGTSVNNAQQTIDTTKRCSVCGNEEVESVKYVNYSATAATCLEPAKNTYYNAYSNDPNRQVVFEEYVGEPDPKGHDVKMADCEWTWSWDPSTGNYTVSVLAVCSRDSSHTHEFAMDDMYVSVIKNTCATCTESGEFHAMARVNDAAFMTFSNQRNGSISNWPHYYSEPLGHELTEHAVKPATCVEAGNTAAYWTCDRCGKYFSDANGEHEITREEAEAGMIPATGEHTYDDGTWVFNYYTANNVGTLYFHVIGTFTCTQCGDTYSVTGESATGLGYVTVSSGITGLTCTKDGVVTDAKLSYTDKDGTRVTNKLVSGTAPAPGHADPDSITTLSYDTNGHYKACNHRNGYGLPCKEKLEYEAHDIQRKVTKEPTCETSGMYQNACTVCGKVKSAGNIPALGHTLTAHEAIAATCTESGSIAYWTCDTCGEYFADEAGTEKIAADEITIPATGHTPSTGWKQSDSRHWHFCTTCKAQLDPVSHTWSEGVVTTPATCTEDGVMTYTCTVCKRTRTEVIPAINHDYGEWTIITAPTADASGLAQRVCANDSDHVEEIDLPRLPDETDETWELTAFTAPTCTEAGEAVYTSDYGTVTVTLEALGHTVAIDAAVAATCEETGLTEGAHCSDCGAVLTAQTVIPATGHSYDEGVVTLAPTADTDGVLTYTCTLCGETSTEVIPATGEEPGEDPEGPSDSEAPDENPGDVIIPDDDVPMAEEPDANDLTIEDEAVPLADVVTLAELLEELRQHEEIDSIELPEDFKFIDHDYAQAIYWALAEGLVVDTEEDPLDPDEIVTVGLLQKVLDNFVETYKELEDFDVTVEGEADEMVLDLGERLAAFYADLELELAKAK